MGDCSNAEMRDALPDLMRADMNAADRVRVEAHVASCQECSAELVLLERVREISGRSPLTVDVDGIVRALPAPRRQTRWASSPALRIAATLALIIGAGSYAALNRQAEPVGRDPVKVAVATVPAQDSIAARRTEDPNTGKAPSAPRSRTARPALSLDGGLDDFSDAELQTLLAALDSFEAEVGIEPEAVAPVPDMEGLR